MGWQDDAVVAPPPAAVQAQPAWSQDEVVAPAPAAQVAAPPPKQSLWQQYVNSAFAPVAQGEALANVGTAAIAAPVSGLAGIAQGAWNTVVPQRFEGPSAADRVAQVGGAMTYQPRTTGGQKIAGAVAYPFEKLAQGADAAGNVVNNVTGSPALATGVNTAIQAAPALLFRGRGKAAAAEKEAKFARAAESEAQQFVKSNTSLDWNGLSTSVKTRLTEIAKDAGNLDLLDARALERQATLESLPEPVFATRGKLTRDPVQLRNEGNVSATEAGRPIREADVAANKALLKNLEILKGKVKGKGERASTAETPEQVGMSVQDAALREKAAASKRKYDFLYKKARATEPNASVGATPIQELLSGSPEIQNLGFVDSWLKKANPEKSGGQLKLGELQDLRTKASEIARTGGTEGYYAGKVVGAIDEAMQQVPAAAKSWKDAQAAFKKHKMEFEEQGAVERLVTDKSRTDRSTALENTWTQVVKGGSIEDLQKVKRSLLTGEDAAARNAGIKAWRDIRAQTVQHIINEATKSVTRYEDGTSNLTPAAMERAIKSIGDEKLREIFGDTTVKQLNKIMEATRLVKTEPPAGFKGSPTLANTIAILEKSIGKIPFVGDTISGAVKGVANLKDLGANSRDARSAMRTPLDDAQSIANQLRDSRVRGNALRTNAALVIPAQEQRR